jgi:hypothetical protein
LFEGLISRCSTSTLQEPEPQRLASAIIMQAWNQELEKTNAGRSLKMRCNRLIMADNKEAP